MEYAFGLRLGQPRTEEMERGDQSRTMWASLSSSFEVNVGSTELETFWATYWPCKHQRLRVATICGGIPAMLLAESSVRLDNTLTDTLPVEYSERRGDPIRSGRTWLSDGCSLDNSSSSREIDLHKSNRVRCDDFLQVGIIVAYDRIDPIHLFSDVPKWEIYQ